MRSRTLRLVDLERVYQQRFSGIDSSARQVVWDEITRYLERRFGVPNRLLDVACGSGEFITASTSAEKWALDSMPGLDVDPKIRFKQGEYLSVELPEKYFDMIFMSNILEHLSSREHVSQFLARAFQQLEQAGHLVVLGPNFRYTMKQYFDFADHNIIITHKSMVEFLIGAGFVPQTIIPRFLPYSFRSRRALLPGARYLTRLYLRFPPLWHLMGRQFLIVAIKQ